MLHIILADYVPFIILLWSLYTISGGILLRGKLRGTPVVNLIMLIIGTGLMILLKSPQLIQSKSWTREEAVLEPVN